ncbi:TPA: MarR family transcriptional regulator [Klebsiella variicola]|uniref:MarR family transcriptional regulator n=1 Tax=Klebsiella variicola TaxID=244366 RepID=UPI0019AF6E22|nr:MarR family transcriptional regulator [Klebsiella variicola]EKZ9690366.1 MarR family transcriptional regulator [Klebsiella pneumoniae]EKZ9879469.1 MarR family transcriptional regulator [Klebsiella pneumoniae]ELA0009088.1 MarR family transcriptional regulator [Klebsiella pneumoniae]ELA0120431.1 MarR family transcriptional regulator [Klebsiella pneumoniae]
MAKKSKYKYRNEITAFEFLRAHPDMTSGEIARAMGRSASSVSGQIKQLVGSGRVVQTGMKNGSPTWRVNDMPFGCGNPIRMKFEKLLQEHRSKEFNEKIHNELEIWNS